MEKNPNAKSQETKTNGKDSMDFLGFITFIHSYSFHRFFVFFFLILPDLTIVSKP